MKIIFTHIQKTSGTSVNHILKSQPGMNIWSRNKNDNLPDIITGHTPFGIHKKLGITDPSYFTFLRNPIDRWISQFNHGVMRHRKTSFAYAVFQFLRNDVNSFLQWCLYHESSCNIMVKQICGNEPISNMIRWEGSENCDMNRDFGYYQIYGWAGRAKKHSDSAMKNMLEQAKKNLIEKYDFVGFQSVAAESQKKLCKFYDFKYDGKEIMKRIASKKFPIDMSDKKTEKLLNEINRYDIKLYEFAIKEIRSKRYESSN